MLEADVVADGAGNGQLVERTTQVRLSLKVLEASKSKTFRPRESYASWENLDLEQKVSRLAAYISDSTGLRVLFIVDEVDRLDTYGLAPFIKATSSASLRFLLVGIGQTIAELMSDHSSIERIVRAVDVPRMTRKELMQIPVRALGRLADQGFEYNITDTAKRVLAETSCGFPWFVHVIGQEALLASFEDDTRIVEALHIENAINELAKNRFAQHFRDQYQQAVRDSPNREIVLRALAEWRDADIPLTEVYKITSALGVANGSVYRGQLVQEKYGSVLMVPPYQDRGLVRFRNEMFKIYCRIRPSFYSDVDTNIRDRMFRTST